MSGLPAVPPPTERALAGPEAELSERDRELLRYFVERAFAEYLANLKQRR